MVTLINTGLRAEELTLVQATDIRWLLVQRGKGGRGRVVDLSPIVAEAMLRYQRFRNPNEPSFFQSKTGTPLTTVALGLLWRKLCDRAGIKGPKRGPHAARHTMATQYLRAGGECAIFNPSWGTAP